MQNYLWPNNILVMISTWIIFRTSLNSPAVLSKNPIRKIGEALMKVKSITKVKGTPWCWALSVLISVLYSYCSQYLSWFQLSLSYCELQGINTSLKSCVELIELRLAHNEIKVCFISVAFLFNSTSTHQLMNCICIRNVPYSAFIFHIYFISLWHLTNIWISDSPRWINPQFKAPEFRFGE